MSLRRTFIAAFVVTFVLCLLRLPASTFLYDANFYWSGTAAIFGEGSTAQAGLLNIRGALTPLVYLPSSLATYAGVPATVAVLVQNSLLLAAVGSLLLPALLGRLITVTRRHIWVSGIATAALLSGFARYPLMDVWAVALMLLGILLLLSRSGWLLAAAGLSFAVAGNLRPAYLVPVVVIAVLWGIPNWRRLLWPALGVVVGFLPQIAFNRVFAYAWSPFPVSAGEVALVQATYAGYTVLYDTVAYVETSDPRQFFCSPDMAAVIGSTPPSSTLDLLGLFLTHPVQSIPFAAQKTASTFAWEWATPYALPAAGGFPWVSLIVIAAVAVGIVAFVARTVRGARTTPTALFLLSLVATTIVTIVGSTPETRFSVAIVLVAILGLAMLSSPPSSPLLSRTVLIPALVAVLLAVAITALAVTGLQHPATPGNIDSSDCIASD